MVIWGLLLFSLVELDSYRTSLYNSITTRSVTRYFSTLTEKMETTDYTQEQASRKPEMSHNSGTTQMRLIEESQSL